MKIWPGCWIWLSASFAAAASASAQMPKEISLRNPQNGMLIVSVLGGSVEALTASSSNIQTDENLVQAAIYRVNFDLVKSSEYAQACFDAESKQETGKSIVTATLCGLMVAGNHLLANDMPGWAKRRSDLKAWAYPRLKKMLNQSSLRVSEFGDFNNDSIIAWPSLVIERPHATESAIPIRWQKAFENSVEQQPFVSVTINGHKILMLLDTGTSKTMLDRATAKLLGVAAREDDFASVGDAQRRQADIGIGRLESLSIGGVTMQNLPVAIGQTPLPILGLDVLIALGNIQIRHDMLRIYGTERAKSPICDAPLHIGSNINGFSASLIMDIEAQGRPNLAFFDSGDTTYVAGIRHDIPPDAPGLKSRSKTLLMGDAIEKYYDANFTMGLGSVKKTLTFPVRIDNSLRYATPYVLGNPILSDVSVFIDFINRKACFVPN